MTTEMISLRSLVGTTLLEEAKHTPEIYVLDSDLAHSTTTDKFEKVYPDRYVETGIAEQDAASIASGIAYMGGIPFFVDFAIFVAGTAFTQIRMACYANINLKLIATHPGMDGGFDGASHHADEDIALMRSLPNMHILIPSNPEELCEAVHIAAVTPGPFYIRCSRDNVPNVKASVKSEIGKSKVVRDEGSDFAMIFEGSVAEQAFDGYEKALEQGFHGKLINIFSMKPLDKKMILKIAGSVKAIVTVENHSVIGGLGSAVAEVISTQSHHAKLCMIGVEDCFTESGKSKQVKEKYGLSGENILKKITETLKD